MRPSFASSGADTVIDYRTGRFEDTVRDADAVIDLVGGDTQKRSFQVLRRGGKLISAVSEPDQVLAQRHGVEAAFFLVQVTTAELAEIASLIDDGKLRIGVGVVLSLADAPQAHLMLEGLQAPPEGKDRAGDAAGVTSKEARPMSNLSPALVIPDSLLAKEATGILREHSSDLIFNHSVRVYLFAAEQGRQQKLRFDAELLYIAAAFHDLGLIKKFSSENERFEVDGANAARQFLSTHNVPEEQVRTVWEAIALHTTPGITQHMQPGSGAALFGRRSRRARKRVRPVSCRKCASRSSPGTRAGTSGKTFIREYFAGFAHKPQHHVRHRERRRL